jgi:hypothetical protein
MALPYDLRTAGTQLAAQLSRTAPDDVAAAAVPALLAAAGAKPAAAVQLLLGREATWPAAAEWARRLNLHEVQDLAYRPALPPDVLDVVAPRLSRSSWGAQDLARRADLTVAVAARLAGQKRSGVRRALHHNRQLPVPAAWKISPLVKRLAENGRAPRYSRARADAVIVDAVAGVAGAIAAGGSPTTSDRDDATGLTVAELTRAAFALLGGDRMPAAVGDAVVALVGAGAVPRDALEGWLGRGVSGEAGRYAVAALEAFGDEIARVRQRSGVTPPGAEAVAWRGCGEPLEWTDGRVRVWRDAGSVAALAGSAHPRLRALALAHPALAREAAGVAAAGPEGASSREEWEAAAANPALPADDVAQVLARHPDWVWLADGNANVGDDLRAAVLASPSGPRVTALVAAALNRKTVLAGTWVEAWLARDLLAAAVSVSDSLGDTSTLAGEALMRWPDLLDTLVEHLTPRHAISPAAAWLLADRIGAMTGDQAAVAAGLVGDWDQPLVALVRAVGELVPATTGATQQ